MADAISLKPIQRQRVKVRIVGKSALVHHNWSDKAARMIREKQAGRKTKEREARDPEAEGKAAMYLTADGKYGAPAMSFKKAMITAAHKDLGVEKTLVKKALFSICDDPALILPLDCDEPEIREDPVRVGQGSTDLRYRPYYHRWGVDLEFEIDASLLRVSDLINLINRAGFGTGVGEGRPETGGENGRFEADPTAKVDVEKIE